MQIAAANAARAKRTRSSFAMVLSKESASFATMMARSPPSTLHSQLAQEIDHCGIDFRRAFLLDPMTAVLKNYCSTQARHIPLQTGDNLIHALLPIASHVKRPNGASSSQFRSMLRYQF